MNGKMYTDNKQVPRHTIHNIIFNNKEYLTTYRASLMTNIELGHITFYIPRYIRQFYCCGLLMFLLWFMAWWHSILPKLWAFFDNKHTHTHNLEALYLLYINIIYNKRIYTLIKYSYISLSYESVHYKLVYISEQNFMTKKKYE